MASKDCRNHTGSHYRAFTLFYTFSKLIINSKYK